MTMLMEPLAPWLRELDRFISSAGTAAFVPAADVIVTQAGVTVFIDVPGMRRDDLEIELENDTLTVRGERRPPEQLQGDERAWRHIERRFGRFQRTMRVPGGMNPDAVEAQLADGVLALQIPRAESPRPHRVQIQAQRDSEGAGGVGTSTSAAAGAGGATGAGAAETSTTGAGGAGAGDQAGDPRQAPATGA
jgi:HSP20 family protein